MGTENMINMTDDHLHARADGKTRSGNKSRNLMREQLWFHQEQINRSFRVRGYLLLSVSLLISETSLTGLVSLITLIATRNSRENVE